MASIKESGLTSPTGETVDRKQQHKTVTLRPGHHSLNTSIQLTCDNHKDKKATVTLAGDVRVTYREAAGLSKWEDFKSCELAGCQIATDTTQSHATTLLCLGALQQALGNAAQLKFSLKCGHEVVPACSTCSPSPSRAHASCQTEQDHAAGAQENAPGASNLTAARTDMDESGSQESDSSSTSSDYVATPADSIVEERETQERDLPCAIWFPHQKKPKKPATTAEPVQKDEAAESTHTKESDKSDPADPTTEKDAVKTDPSSDEALLPKTKISKERKAQRAAALKKQREERLKAHEEELEDIREEIDHQKEVLRAQRDEKRQKKKLVELQRKWQRLVNQESQEVDYVTSDSEYGSESEEKPLSSEDSGENQESETSGESSSEKEGEDNSKGQGEEDPKAWPVPHSKAKEEWEKQKSDRNQSNMYLDEVMDMIGLESVKTKMLEIKSLVDTARRQNADLSKERFNTLFTGNPGTGKTKIANLYAQFLSSMGLVVENFASTTGAKLVYEGVHEVKSLINNIDAQGIILVDDAHHLRPAQSSTGRKVLDFITAEMDRLQGQVIFVFTGYGKEMEALLGHNQSLQSRTPFAIKFDDYEDTELHQMLVKKLHDKFDGNMRVAQGERGIYMRILARRIGRGRGAPSFGNAREVENAMLRVLFRQAGRLERARRAQQQEGEAAADDMLLTMEDIVGPPPSTALERSKAWKGLQGMVGLRSVKDSLRALVHRLQVNYDRELAEKPVVECSLNRIFLGNPGTGKTTVAKHYGQIMVDLGLLSNGEVVVKNPSDFIGEYLGESENITKGILAASRGKVLIIDEAYALSDRSDEANDRSCGNIYKTAIVDTLVAQIQGTINEDRVVLLLGYKDRMERMFQAVNPGLGRRFPMSAAFEFEDFSDDELKEILELKLNEQGYTATDQAKEVAMEVLTRARSHRNFGNAGEIDILLSKAKELQQGRLADTAAVSAKAEATKAEATTTESTAESTAEAESTKTATTEKEYDPLMLEPQDIDPDFDRANVAESRIRELFQDFVGADDIVDKLVGYSRMAQSTKALDIDPRTQIPFNYLFRGPPGTGKTTTAKRIGQVFYDMGLLATNQVYDCSATDLIGEYRGHTGPKTQKVFQRALGKVLFIDEAYRLNDDSYGKEALIEMLNILTKDAYKNKVVTILAVYNDDINALLKVNPGLSSRFPEVIQFPNLTPKQCHELLVQRLGEQKVDAGVVAKPGSKVADRLRASFERLAALPDWGNARDVDALAKAVLGRMLRERSSSSLSSSGTGGSEPTSEKPSLVVKEDTLDAEVEAMISEREQRAGSSCPVSHIYL